MKDILTWEDAHFFDYINEIEYLYIPDVDDYKYRINISKGGDVSDDAIKIETPVFGYSEIIATFKNRYNEGVLLKQKQYLRYIKVVGHLLEELELEPEKFWCLFLFALDYCNSLLGQGKTMKATPLEQLQTFVDLITNADKTVILRLKAGKAKMDVESPVALQFMAEAIQNQLKTADLKPLYIREQEEEAKQISDSPIIVYFAKMLLTFFNTQDHIRQKRKEGANFSTKEKDLVSQLVYFSGLSTNDSWTDIENDTLKAFLKQYKNYQYPNNVSSIYPEFTIF